MALNINGGEGYRVGTSDRTIGGSTGAPDDFVVLNLQNNKLFVAASNLWTDGGDFPGTPFTQQNFDDWLLS